MVGEFGVYMDYQASTPLDPRVLSAMLPHLEGARALGNPHAADHAYGWSADAAIAESREAIARLIGADADEIVFTSGATEANNLALLGAARAARPGRREIVVSAIEHKCVLEVARALVDEGFLLRVAPVRNDGVIDLDELAALVGHRTAVVSVMAVNNEVGVVQPVRAVAELCNSVGAMFHSDAAQALAVEQIDVEDWKVDLLSLSAHKAYGPKGIGALYVGREKRSLIRPIMFGGGQENGLRPGTLPTPLCVGFGEACNILRRELTSEAERVRELRDRFLELLRIRIPDLSVIGTMANRHAGNLNVRIPGIEAELLLAAARPKLAAATGSACTSGVTEPSHVLTALGLSPIEAAEAVRLSIGRFTKDADIDAGVSAFALAAEEVHRSFAIVN
jgi:cysteine desulfurase